MPLKEIRWMRQRGFPRWRASIRRTTGSRGRRGFWRGWRGWRRCWGGRWRGWRGRSGGWGRRGGRGGRGGGGQVGELLAQKGSLLAHLARVHYNLAQNTAEGEERKALVYRAQQEALHGVQNNGGDWFCHKWRAITLSEVGKYEGTRRSIEDAFVIKQHLDEALRLNPADPTTHHIQGVWCFTFADLSWVMRNVAAAIFASPPSASYDDALRSFLTAEQLAPGFYLKNVLYLCMTCRALGDLPEARRWKEFGLTLPVTNDDDRDALKQDRKSTRLN